MLKLAPVICLILALSACAHQRQPKARCTGPLERINIAAPASTERPAPDRSPQPQVSPTEEPKDEGSGL
jgi:hypothetical protein